MLIKMLLGFALTFASTLSSHAQGVKLSDYHPTVTDLATETLEIARLLLNPKAAKCVGELGLHQHPRKLLSIRKTSWREPDLQNQDSYFLLFDDQREDYEAALIIHQTWTDDQPAKNPHFNCYIARKDPT